MQTKTQLFLEGNLGLFVFFYNISDGERIKDLSWRFAKPLLFCCFLLRFFFIPFPKTLKYCRFKFLKKLEGFVLWIVTSFSESKLYTYMDLLLFCLFFARTRDSLFAIRDKQDTFSVKKKHCELCEGCIGENKLCGKMNKVYLLQK